MQQVQADVVRREVSALLEQSQAFQQLPAEARARIASDTSRVVEALASGPSGGSSPGSSRDPYAMAQADEPAPDRFRADDPFRAEAVAAGVTQTGRLIREVNFPAFVSSLVKGTFNAVVDASITQMQAYAELVKSVAMSLGDFRDANVDQAAGRDHLLKKYPQVFKQETRDEGTRLGFLDDFDFDNVPDFARELNLPEAVAEPDEEYVEQVLVPAARDEVARSRQQLLATTILMGINRIIVTDGKINAKVRFDFAATDSITRDGVASQYEDKMRVSEFEFNTARAHLSGRTEIPVPIRVATTMAHTEGEIDAEAQLRGEVSLNFKSETFPLERMLDSAQLLQLERAQAGGPPTNRAPAATPSAEPAPAPGRS